MLNKHPSFLALPAHLSCRYCNTFLDRCIIDIKEQTVTLALAGDAIRKYPFAAACLMATASTAASPGRQPASRSAPATLGAPAWTPAQLTSHSLSLRMAKLPVVRLVLWLGPWGPVPQHYLDAIPHVGHPHGLQ